jgi:hypothetical protein
MGCFRVHGGGCLVREAGIGEVEAPVATRAAAASWDWGLGEVGGEVMVLVFQ